LQVEQKQILNMEQSIHFTIYLLEYWI